MPWKAGKKTSKGVQILKKSGDKWKVVGHSSSKETAKAAVRARYANKGKGKQ